MRFLKAAVLYFPILFGVGFVLGTIRTLWVVPRVGTRNAELLELPMMFIVSIFASAAKCLKAAIFNSCGPVSHGFYCARTDVACRVGINAVAARHRHSTMSGDTRPGFGHGLLRDACGFCGDSVVGGQSQRHG
jgi:hypothetical protein